MSRAGFRLSEPARSDLFEIVTDLAERDPEVARRTLEELRRALDRLAAHPGIGHRREVLTQHEELRFYSVRGVLIAYRFEPRPLEIVRILHGRRDVSRLLEE